METYPNVHLDLGARIGWSCFLDREKYRDFLIRYSDRILFGTDIADRPLDEQTMVTVRRYHRCFEILETDRILNAGFFPPPGGEKREIKGLALPVDVLEKIYYRNAVRLYPRVKEVLEALGYPLE